MPRYDAGLTSYRFGGYQCTKGGGMKTMGAALIWRERGVK